MNNFKKRYPGLLTKKDLRLWSPKMTNFHLWLNNEYFGKLTELNKSTAIQKAKVIGRLHKAKTWALNYSTVINDGNVGAGEVK